MNGVPLNKFAGYGGQSQKIPSFERSYASNGSSSNANIYSQKKMQMLPGSSDDRQMSNGQADDSHYLSGSKSVGQLQPVNSRIANFASADYEKISSQQALKRTLPTFPQPYSLNTKSKNSVEDVNSNQIRDTFGNSYHLAGPSTVNSKGYMRDYYVKKNDDDIMMYEGNRILPPSLMHGKSVSMTQFGGPSDLAYRSGSADERVGSDERLIYQAALEVFETFYLCKNELNSSCFV